MHRFSQTVCRRTGCTVWALAGGEEVGARIAEGDDARAHNVAGAEAVGNLDAVGALAAHVLSPGWWWGRRGLRIRARRGQAGIRRESA